MLGGPVFKPTATDLSVPYLKQYASGRENAEDRIYDLLSCAEESGDEFAAWLSLKWVRELLCSVPADKNIEQEFPEDAPLYQLRYTQCLPDLYIYLDNYCFCKACNVMVHMIYAGCMVYPDVRNVVVDVLASHKNLQRAFVL